MPCGQPWRSGHAATSLKLVPIGDASVPSPTATKPLPKGHHKKPTRVKRSLVLALIGSTTRLGPAYPREECFKRILVGPRVNVPCLGVIGAVHTYVGDEIGAGLCKAITRFNGHHAIGSPMQQQSR